MLVYGDHSRRRDPRDVIGEVSLALAKLTGAGITRHAALVTIFVTAAELAQGLADAAFEAAGCDGPSPPQDAAMAFLMAAARAVILSWRSGFDRRGSIDPVRLTELERLDLPAEITLKQAEGYAFYAVYPEAYALAALSSGLGPDTRVIGLRSIGGGLAAMVAAALDAAAPVTFRPVGHPFQRQLAISPDLQASLLADPAARYAIVDEGPGLSGSSFGAVADWLEEHGVTAERIVFFPSHAGDLGSQASARHRQRWAKADRWVADFERLAGEAKPGAMVAAWVQELVGAPESAVADLSGGAWRAHSVASETLWPGVDTFQERRKFLITTEGGDWLAKFAGLGADGERKASRATALAEAGFTPPVAGLRRGFLLTRWRKDVEPLDLSRLDRSRFVDHLARYLGFRTRSFPASPDEGASTSNLWEMASVNITEAFGGLAAATMTRWRARLPTLQSRLSRVQTDNRLQSFEWLSLPEGGWLKADAVDHAFAHDLIGPQDIAWDLAGAAVEFALTPFEQAHLRAGVEYHGGRAVDSDLLAFYLPCYLAFQLGAYTMAADSHGHWFQERARLAAARDRYADDLKRVVEAARPAL